MTIENAYRTLRSQLLHWLQQRVHDQTIAEDLLQEVFYKAIRADERNSLPNNLQAWLYTVARNTVIDHYRTQHPHTEWSDNINPESNHGNGEETDTTKQLANCCLLPLTKQLPPIYRDTLLATDFAHTPQRVLAEETGVSVSAIKSRVSRGRKLLRQQLLDCCLIELSRHNQVLDCHKKASTK